MNIVRDFFLVALPQIPTCNHNISPRNFFSSSSRLRNCFF